MTVLDLTTVQARGVRDCLRILGKVEPSVKRQAQKRLKQAVGPILTDARQFIPERPLSGWRPGGRTGWQQARAQKSIRVTMPRIRYGGRVKLIQLVQKDAAGSIYELAGRKSSGRTKSGRVMIETLNADYGRAGRAVWRAIDVHKNDVRQALEDAIADTVALLEQAVKQAN